MTFLRRIVRASGSKVSSLSKVLQRSRPSERAKRTELFRFAGQAAVVLFISWIAILAVGQFIHLIARDLALNHDLVVARADIQRLSVRRDHEIADIARLHQSRGAVPEIHRLLGLFAPDEREVFLRGPSGVVRPTETTP
ncbi:MAG TPA: hypothetical protein VGZ00_03570 [Candidatus Baltobacteraceae bacterium]|nr:hypothetical protein [Candidatus Baltobacteraceae bacterium]